MQSSAMVALRTMIMITCLVAVPLAAVLGTALPKVVQSAFVHRGGNTSLWKDAATEEEPAPPVLAVDDVEQAAPAQAVPESALAENSLRLPTAHITGIRPVHDGLLTPPSAAPAQTAPLWSPPPRTAQAPNTRNMTAHFAPSPLPARLDDAYTRHEPRAEGLQKTVYSQPHGEAADESGEDNDRLVAVERPTDSSAIDNVLADGERRLRKLGATYYRLETWGGDGQFYRCSCNIAASGGSRATRHFEAIEAAPSQAIEAVIKQVDTWRARRGRG